MEAHFVDTEKHARGVVTTVLQIGYRGFDIADMYHIESLLAEAFGEASKTRVVYKEDLFVTTMLDPYEEDPVASLKKSLRWLPNPYSLLL